ncbi:MAG TPA: MerR family transcriptional regulator [Myxococcaceae bacterium]|nr:MerR family transcriptional regulator [Myxococcaceae bacterium]
MSLRIRTIARLTGVREATLRAWERRYGFPRPMRAENNYRIYSRDEAEAIRRVAALLREGYSASEAIDQVRSVAPGAAPVLEQARERFWSAVAALDAEGAEAALDQAQRAVLPVSFCDGVLLPALREMTDRLDVAREHLASALVRQRLRALAQAPGPASGPRAVLACPSGERHEGGLLGLGVHLRAMGWRLTVLGADTPAEAVVEAARRVGADVVALSFITARAPEEVEAYVRTVVAGSAAPVVVGGPVARDNARRAAAAGARVAESAEEIAALARRPPLAGAR